MVNLIGFDFKNQLRVNYSSINSCETSSCNEEGICRCTQITDCSVEKVSISQMVEEIHNFYFDKSKSSKRNIKINEILYGINQEIEKYTIDRILRINKVWNNECWEVQLINGYYGQEIDVVILQQELAAKIQNEIGLALSILGINNRIEFLLKLEYGKILPHLQNLDWKLIRLSKDDINIPSQSHLEIVKKKELNYYFTPKYNSIRAVVIKDDDKWKLVDGYHRLSAISLGDFWALAGEKN